MNSPAKLRDELSTLFKEAALAREAFASYAERTLALTLRYHAAKLEEEFNMTSTPVGTVVEFDGLSSPKALDKLIETLKEKNLCPHQIMFAEQARKFYLVFSSSPSAS